MVRPLSPPHHCPRSPSTSVSRPRITTALPCTRFAVPITQETTDNAFPALRVKGHLIAASKSEATGTKTLEASGLYKAEWFVHRDSGVPR